ncbi:MAG: carboxypeptidase-like regulatory domain-containing protein [Planctomycetota bacterium]
MNSNERSPRRILVVAAFALGALLLAVLAPRERRVASPVGSDSIDAAGPPPRDDRLAPLAPRRRAPAPLELEATGSDASVAAATAAPVHIAARVVDRDSRRPLEGVGVFLHDRLGSYQARGGSWSGLSTVLAYPTSLTPPSAVTNVHGSFSFPTGPGSPRFATVVAPDWTCRILELDALENVEEAEVELVPSGRVDGRVTGAPEGSRAEVWIDPADLMERRHSQPNQPVTIESAVDARGSFTVTGIPAFAGFMLRLVDGGGERLIAEPDELRLGPGETRRIDWGLARGARVSGTVFDASGRPLSGVEVGLLSPRCWWGPTARSHGYQMTQRAVSNEVGAFKFSGATPGAWCVSVTPNAAQGLAGGPFVPLPREIVVRPDDEDLTVDVHIAPALDLEGIVVAPDGTPIYAYVRVVDAEGRWVAEQPTATDGRFRIRGLAPGSLRVVASPTDRRGPELGLALSREVSTTAGSRDVRVELRTGAAITARAVDAISGKPVGAHFQILHPALDRPRNTEGRQRARPSFRTGLLPAGRASVAAFTDDGRAGFVDSIELVPRGPRTEVSISLVPAGFLRLQDDGVKGQLHADVVRSGTKLRETSTPIAEESVVPLPPGRYSVHLRRVGLRGGAPWSESAGVRRVSIVEGRETVVRAR